MEFTLILPKGYADRQVPDPRCQAPFGQFNPYRDLEHKSIHLITSEVRRFLALRMFCFRGKHNSLGEDFLTESTVPENEALRRSFIQAFLLRSSRLRTSHVELTHLSPCINVSDSNRAILKLLPASTFVFGVLTKT